MLFESIPSQIVVLEDKSSALHDSHSLGENLFRVEVVRHIDYNN